MFFFMEKYGKTSLKYPCYPFLSGALNTQIHHSIEVHLKLLISQCKFSGPRKFTLRYQKFEISRVEMQGNIQSVPKLSSLTSEGALRHQCWKCELTVI